MPQLVLKLTMKTITAILLAAITISCTDNTRAEKTLENAGMHAIELQGFAWVGCGNTGFSSTKFRACNDYHEMLDGAVCCSLAGSCRIHYTPVTCRACDNSHAHLHLPTKYSMFE
jgi:hypothetical protein